MYVSGHQLFGYCSSHKTCLWVWETLSCISVVSILIQPDWTFLHWVGVYIIIVAILPGKTSEYWEDRSVTTVLIYSINHLSYEKMYQWLWYLFPPNPPRMLGTIFRSITQKRGSNNWYYKLIMQLLSNIRYHTSNDRALALPFPFQPSTCSSSSSESAAKRSIAFFKPLLSSFFFPVTRLESELRNVFSSYCLMTLTTLFFFCHRPVWRIVKYSSKSLKWRIPVLKPTSWRLSSLESTQRTWE